ncbi:MAG TPA: hypothetical protein VHV10_07400 [Ktedonobacteraceae bacterium]|nr:hypothetical protein [Ktedonobacteraceae bacterium]
MFTGKLISVKSEGLAWPGTVGYDFTFRAANDATQAEYGTQSTVNFFNSDDYKFLQGREGQEISWKRNDSNIPIFQR